MSDRKSKEKSIKHGISYKEELFTIRLWQEKIDDIHSEWRGKIQHTGSGKAHYFRDWPIMIRFAEDILSRLKSSQTSLKATKKGLRYWEKSPLRGRRTVHQRIGETELDGSQAARQTRDISRRKPTTKKWRMGLQTEGLEPARFWVAYLRNRTSGLQVILAIGLFLIVGWNLLSLIPMAVYFHPGLKPVWIKPVVVILG